MYQLHPKEKHFSVRKNVYVLLIIISLCAITAYYVLQKSWSITGQTGLYVMLLRANKNVSCHYLNEGDALPAAEASNFSPKPGSIFFHETSCRGGLNSREACAIESAARAHPERQIYLLFSGPVSDTVYTKSCLAKLRLFQNINVARVHIQEYAKKTPLEEMVARKPFSRSEWWMEHTSDVLRSLTLYKWGGVYLDTDMIVAKSLTPLGKNWVAKEDNTVVNAAAIAMSKDDVGRRLAEALINELRTTYRPDIWNHNGPRAITRVLQKLCDTPNVPDWSSKTCHGIEAYEPKYVYPVHYSRKDIYFKPGDIGEELKNAYTHHFWNKLTHDMHIQKKSPYWQMAEEFCPSIFQMYGDNFGN